jgi:atypical dual specificity phosphatase
MLSFPQQKWQLARSLTQIQAGDGEPIHLIVDRLYLGNWGAATDSKKLTELGITHVVSVFEHSPDIPDVVPRDNLLHIQINDTVSTDILCHLDKTTDFIQSALEVNKNHKVLVSSRP